MSQFVIILLTTVILLLVWLWWHVRNHKFVKCLEKFPGPKPLPIVGNGLEFTSNRDILPALLKYNEKYGGIVKLHIGLIPNMLIIQDYKFVEFLLTSTKILDKCAEYKFAESWLGDGILTSDGNSKWKKHRKIITPTFHSQLLEQFIAQFDGPNDILINKFQAEVGKDSVNIFPFISTCTLDMICETMLGTAVNAQNNPNSEYVQSVKDMCGIIINRTFNPLLQNSLLYYFFPQYRIEKHAVEVLHDYTNSVIRRRKHELEQHNDAFDSEATHKNKKNCLDLLLEASAKGAAISDQQIREEVDTLMFAGHDTTAVSLCFTLFSLAENPDVQNKLVAELQNTFTDGQYRPCSMQELQEMKYLEAVIKESLRLYPPVPFYARRINQDVEYDGTTLPKGLTLIIQAFGIHRNPEVFPEPLKFRPERFLDNNPTAGVPYAYIPFSAGPRKCIGQKFAMLEMKSTLAKILMNFQLLPAVPKHELQLVSETVLNATNGICIRVVDRIV